MSVTLDEAMANEWWFKVRERIGKNWPPINSTTALMIEDDILARDRYVSVNDARKAAHGACEILKERVARFVMAEALAAWLAGGMSLKLNEHLDVKVLENLR